MRIKNGYILKNIAGSFVVISLDSTETESRLITLNEVGAFLWKRLETETTAEQLSAALLKEYAIDETTARKDIAMFLDKCRKIGVLEWRNIR